MKALLNALIRLWMRAVRFGFWALYNPLAFTYDAVSWVVSMGAWGEWTHTSLRHLPPGARDVLEIAHGTGNLQRTLYQRGYHVVGCDLSPAMGRIARHKLMQAGYAPRLVRARVQQLPFARARFDAVISTFPTDYIVQSETLASVARVLKPGGRLIIVPGASFTGGGAWRRVLDLAYWVTGQREPPRASQGDHTPDDPTLAMRRRIELFGFTTRMHAEPCRRSIAYVIVAERIT